MKIKKISAECYYSELNTAIASSIELAIQYKAVIRLAVLKDIGKSTIYGRTIYGKAICTISENSKIDVIKSYIDKVYKRGQFKKIF